MAFWQGICLSQSANITMTLLQEKSTHRDCRSGALNLLQNCAEIKEGESLLVVQEDSELGWYDAKAAQTVIEVAQELGVSVSVHRSEQISNATTPVLDQLRATHDCTVFFARAGDQQRFSPAPPGQRSIMCYARDAGMLASRYGTTHHVAMLAMKQAIDEIIRGAQTINISCPLGTDFRGDRLTPGNTPSESELNDVGILRFPQGVHSPVSTQYFTGQIALSNYVTSTGSACYQPDHLSLEGVVLAQVADGKTHEFTGRKTDIKRLQDHYRHVSNLFGLNPEIVHSWHAGIHPGCCYPASVHDDPDRWGNNVFTHPGILHFHTCGDAPGEISWNIENPTITMDGCPLWDRGRLHVEDFLPTRSVLKQWPELQTLYKVHNNDH